MSGDLPPESPDSPRAVEIPGVENNSQAQRELDALAHEGAQFKKELGWIGTVFGGRQEKAGNISVFVIILCFLALTATYGAETWINVKFSPAGQKVEPVIPFEHLFTWTSGPPLNVAQLFKRMADGIRDGKSASPGFDLALTRHRLLDAIQKASDSGVRQVL